MQDITLSTVDLAIVAVIVVDAAGTLFAWAIVLTVFIPGLDLFSAALLLAGLPDSTRQPAGLPRWSTPMSCRR